MSFHLMKPWLGHGAWGSSPGGVSRTTTRAMTGEPLDRSLHEIRDRKQDSRAAYAESHQLERALAALDEDPQAGAGQRRLKGGRPGAGERPGANGGSASVGLTIARERISVAGAKVLDHRYDADRWVHR